MTGSTDVNLNVIRKAKLLKKIITLNDISKLSTVLRSSISLQVYIGNQKWAVDRS